MIQGNYKFKSDLRGFRSIKNHKAIKSIVFLYIAILFSACSLISKFDQYAYVQSTSLKVETLALLDEGTNNYAEKVTDVKALEMKLLKAYEYERFRPKNEITTAQWKLIVDPEGNLFGGAMRLWAEQKKLSKTYIENKKVQLSKAFDEISTLEASKIK
ncbi:hypothetical protein ACJVDH_10080 [Pedobacter sp. AW1-32]|uniref:hypothetical protein n=1 Tax=Pedobacter sp. AW1-32 TaxID=3383026 RepID=UPI003FEEED2E